MNTKLWIHEKVNDATLVIFWKMRNGMIGLDAKRASQTMKRASITTPKRMRQITCAESHGSSPPAPVSRPYKKQTVPPMMRAKPVQSSSRRPVRKGSFGVSILRTKKRTIRAIPSKGRLM